MRADSNRRFTRIVFAILMFVALVPVALQAQVDRGVIEVITLDEQGQLIPGVTVTLARPEVGLELVGVTGGNGVARFPALAPGTYQVQAELAGFARLNQTGLAVRVGQTRRVEVVLRPEASETITVTAASNLVDVYKTDSSTNIVPEQIESLPVADRDFQRLAFIAPGVSRERGAFRFIGGGPVLGSGGNASQATIMVDGVNFTDQALGLARTRFGQDAIREFRVISSRFDTEIGGSNGGALSVVTKSGTNQLSGTVFGFYRDDQLRAQGALDLRKSPYQRNQYGFTLGGPVVRDRTHYFLSLEHIDEENVSLFRPGGAFATRAADVVHPFDQLLGFAGLDHQLSNQQSLTAKFVYEDYNEDNFRVGGISDVSYGQQLLRDNWNITGGHNWTLSNTQINELRIQTGKRKYFEPTNSDTVSEWFSSGVTLQTGSNILGDLLGEGTHLELRDTFHFAMGAAHNLKSGLSVHRIKERSVIDTFQNGLFLYLTDTRALPLGYLYGVGSSDVEAETTLYGLFVEDEWRPRSNLSVTLGLRYDLDTDGNNPDFEHPLVPNGRDVDTNNFQPRVGFSWDTNGKGQYVLRGGAGIFTGRYLLVPTFVELQQNGVTGRVNYTRLNGPLIGVPSLPLDINNPSNTGLRLNPDIGLMDSEFNAPESTQASIGLATRLGSTGLYFDVEAIYAEGDNEIVIRDVNFNGNSDPRRPNPAYNQINTYTNEGHSEYTALILAVNGVVGNGHIVTANVTFADKQNVSDDFSPEFPFGYPNDPADIEAEYGPSRSVEDYRAVLSAVFRLPWRFTVAPIFEYGSGQPWTHRLGYDFNGDGKNSDRPSGVGRNEEDGPEFSQFSLRVTKGVALGGLGSVDLIAEAFNLFNEENFDVNSIDAAEFLSGPTLAAPTRAAVRNPNFGNYRATLPAREIQLGLRLAF